MHKFTKYFDSNAFYPTNLQVWQYLFKNQFLNPSSIHKFGREGREKIEYTRDLIKNKLNANDYNLIFCSNGSESNTMAFNSFANHMNIISSTEHVSVINNAKNPIIIDVDTNGLLNLDQLEQKLTELTQKNPKILVSIIWANNETGVMQNMSEIIKICRKYDAIIHSDAISACGKITINLEEIDLDLMSISSHKFGGAPCVGMLFAKKNIKLKPLIYGGGQENGLRAGLENVSAIYANHVLFENWEEHLQKNKEIEKLRDFLEEEILKIDPNCMINGKNTPRICNTSSIIMKNVPSQVQIMFFDLHGFAVSNGSACNSGTVQNSHVLRAMQVSEQDAECVLRISLHSENTKEVIKEFVQLWEKLYRKYN